MAKTGHPNFDYTISSPWRTDLHEWHLVGNHSGSSFNASDAQAFMEGASSPFALCFGPFIANAHSSVVRAAYYDGQASAPIFVGIYDTDNPAPTPLVPTAAAFTTGSAIGNTALECCVMLEAQAGLSSRSKPVYMRKYIHAAPIGFIADGGPASSPKWTFTAAAATAATKMGDGSWYGNRVYCSPSGRQPASNDWQALTEIGNHQMPRGRKRKAAASQGAISTALQAISNAVGSAIEEVG